MTLEEIMKQCDDECEASRQAALREAEDNFPGAVMDRFGPGTIGLHEGLDRTYVQASVTEQYVAGSPAVALCPQAYRLVYVSIQLLNEAYQKLARFDEDGNENSGRQDSVGAGPVGGGA